MYTSNSQTPRHSAASARTDNGHADKGKGKARETSGEIPFRMPNVSPRQKQPIEDGWGDYPIIPGHDGIEGANYRVNGRTLKPKPDRPLLNKANSSFIYTLPTIPQSPTKPMASPTDPSMFKLPPPAQGRAISAPLQPRVTDVSVHMEKDHQQPRPTFHVQVGFTFCMQPGELP